MSANNQNNHHHQNDESPETSKLMDFHLRQLSVDDEQQFNPNSEYQTQQQRQQAQQQSSSLPLGSSLSSAVEAAAVPIQNLTKYDSFIQNSQECVYQTTTTSPLPSPTTPKSPYFTSEMSNDMPKANGQNNHDFQPNMKRNWKRYSNELQHLLPCRNGKINGDHNGIIVDGDDTSRLTKDKNHHQHHENTTTTTNNNNDGVYMDQIDYVNCFQFIFFSWMSPLVNRIFSGRFSLNDIRSCSPFDSCLYTSHRFNRIWSKECAKSGLHNASLEWTLFKFIRTRFLVATFFYILCLITGYLSSTFFIKKLLEEIELISLTTTSTSFSASSVTSSADIDQNDPIDPVITTTTNDDSWDIPYGALKWTIALCFCELLRAICYSIMFGVNIRTGIRAVNALNGTMYRKILTKLPYNIDQRSSLLQPTNLFLNDLSKVFQMIYMLPLVIGTPIIIVITILYTVHLIGHSALFGVVLFVLIFVLQFFLTKYQAKLRDRLMTQADNRVALVTQMMKHIRTIKFNAWEVPFQNDITYCRKAESDLIRKYQYIQCYSTSLALLTPMLITIANILMHTWLEKPLTISTAFSLVMLNYIAAHGIRSLPNYLREIVNGRIALRRIERFIRLDDQIDYVKFELKNPSLNAIELENASFSWSATPELTKQLNRNSQTFTMININLNVPRRAHICLYGPVGAGKTALLMSILGQTQCFRGEVRLCSDRISYVSQSPWLQNGTIRENILFGAPFDKKRYYEVLIKCQLAQDISAMTDGEHTVVGNDGHQLSGGQRQRIALARAVYAQSDIYLFDDFFSALDVRVLKTIFNNILNDLLRHKTVLFVTRHLHLLDEHCLVALLKEGQIVQLDEHGTLYENNQEYHDAVDRSRLLGATESAKILFPINSASPSVVSNAQNNQNNVNINDIIHEDDDNDEDIEKDIGLFEASEDILYDQKDDNNTQSNGVQSSGGGGGLKSDSYASLISLLEKCDQNNYDYKTHQEGIKNNENENVDDDYEDDSNNNDEEVRIFRKYSNKYRKRISKQTSKLYDVQQTKQQQEQQHQNNKRTKLIISAITGSTYRDYIQASGGWWTFSLMVFIFALQTTCSILASWWLGYWLNQGDGQQQQSSLSVLSSSTTTKLNHTTTTNQHATTTTNGSIIDNPSLRYYQTIYLILFIIVFFTSLLMGCVFSGLIVKAANSLHRQLLHKLLHAPLYIFDTIQFGRILNLFSHNIDELDNQLPISLDGFIQRSLLVTGTFVLIISTLHWFTLPFLLYCALFVYIFRHYRIATYWLKQADLRLRSPICQYIQTTIDGLTTIKAFKVDSTFVHNFFHLCDRHQACHWLSLCTVRWLSIRIDLICIMANVTVCVLVLFNLRLIGTAYAGLVITQSMQLSGLLQLVVRLALELETRLVSVERIEAYIHLLLTEPSVTLKTQQNGSHSSSSISPDWPEHGRISFRDVSLRYRARLPLALQSVSFDISPGQRVAIVGRTGAGKSSITYALFRMVELSGGTIHIDGIDIRSIPLTLLRSRLTIIPQDPVLFAGTVRKNLDPFNRYSEAELVEMLEKVHLRQKIVDTFPNGLDEPIIAGMGTGTAGASAGASAGRGNGGGNGGNGKNTTVSHCQFSTGERQLLCLARALLRKSSIIVLDEATAAVDEHTEREIHQIIRSVFAHCTVVLIAHRLQTVLHCDQVLVIHRGKLIEYGDPQTLRENSRSRFAKMVKTISSSLPPSSPSSPSSLPSSSSSPSTIQPVNKQTTTTTTTTT